MFQNLMKIPLFHGVTYQKLSEIIGKHRFNFLKFNRGETIIPAGEPCTHLTTVVSGKVRTSIISADSRVEISQTIEAPETLAPDYLFGRTTRHPATVTALDNCGIMQIQKNDYVDILNSDSVFLFNFLNILSMDAQLSAGGLLSLTDGDLKKRIAYWIVATTQNNSKDITLESRGCNLSQVFGVTPGELTSALSGMMADGLVTFSPTRIEATDRRQLLALLKQ